MVTLRVLRVVHHECSSAERGRLYKLLLMLQQSRGRPRLRVLLGCARLPEEFQARRGPVPVTIGDGIAKGVDGRVYWWRYRPVIRAMGGGRGGDAWDWWRQSLDPSTRTKRR